MPALAAPPVIRRQQSHFQSGPKVGEGITAIHCRAESMLQHKMDGTGRLTTARRRRMDSQEQALGSTR